MSNVERAVATVERGVRDRDSKFLERAYRCLLSGRLRRPNRERGEPLLARALSVLPDDRADAFRREWQQWFRIRDSQFIKVTLAIPTDASVFVNGSYRPPLRTSAGDPAGPPLRLLTLRMAPGDYYINVDDLPPARITVSQQAQPLFVLSPQLRKTVQGTRLRYASSAMRNNDHARDGAVLARVLDCSHALVYWAEGETVQVSLVEATSTTSVRHHVIPLNEWANASLRFLMNGTRGESLQDFTRPRPGRVAVQVTSKRTQDVAVRSTSLWPGAKARAKCTTPCTLYLPPGRAVISSGGHGVAAGSSAISVFDTGNRLALRSPSKAWNTTGKVVGIVGSSVFLATATVVLAGCAGAKGVYDNIPGLPDSDARCPINRATGAILATSAAVSGLGLGIWLWNRPGIADQQPLAAPRRAISLQDRGGRALIGIVPSPSSIVGTMRVRF